MDNLEEFDGNAPDNGPNNPAATPCPLAQLHRDRKIIKKGQGTVSTQDAKIQIANFFWSLASRRCFDTKHKDRAIKCRCLIQARDWLDDEDVDALVDYLYEFALKESKDQKAILAEWMKYGQAWKQKLYNMPRYETRKVFLLPGVPNQPLAMICRNAMTAVLGMTARSWDPLWKKVKEGRPIAHGLVGKASNNKKDFEPALHDFFQDMLQFAGPRATRLIRELVRDRVNMELRDDDDDVLELPTAFSKRALHNRYLLEQGWTFEVDSKMRVIEKKQLQPNDDMDNNPPASWPTFLNFWNKNYPKLVIPSAAEDICNECYMYANRHKYALLEKDKNNEGDDSDDEEGKAESDDEEEANRKMLLNEDLVLKAARHVEMAQRQRTYYQERRQAALDTINNRPSERVLCYVCLRLRAEPCNP
jgi:hypothetical protein